MVVARIHTRIIIAGATRSTTRGYSQRAPSSKHAEWYSSMLPGMIPIALLGSAVYMALHLAQCTLAHEKFLDEADARIRKLEEEVDRLQRERSISAPPTPSKSHGSWWRWP
ncbi:hypothetical protein F5141DRAFT_1006739 [Pisolithus sp. B1]|nr:hypothetical protein F5141DRAFT_1006739 [Pisolithus sp. B1]KAI6134898.1 hypothetical protein EV401DRAFT_1882157 [Pisolithus croceorrhizus]